MKRYKIAPLGLFAMLAVMIVIPNLAEAEILSDFVDTWSSTQPLGFEIPPERFQPSNERKGFDETVTDDFVPWYHTFYLPHGALVETAVLQLRARPLQPAIGEDGLLTEFVWLDGAWDDWDFENDSFRSQLTAQGVGNWGIVALDLLAYGGADVLSDGRLNVIVVDDTEIDWSLLTVGYTLETVSPLDMDIVSTVDNDYDLYVDGNLIMSGNGQWENTEHTSLSLLPGEHTVAVEAWDCGAIGGFLGTFRMGGEVAFNTDSSWKATANTPPEGWKELGFDDSAWLPATEVPESEYWYWDYPTGWNWPDSGIDTENAQWIWTDGYLGATDERVFLRRTFTVVPEPASLILAGAALAGLAGFARKRLSMKSN